MGAQELEAMDHLWEYQEVIFGRVNFKLSHKVNDIRIRNGTLEEKPHDFA